MIHLYWYDLRAAALIASFCCVFSPSQRCSFQTITNKHIFLNTLLPLLISLLNTLLINNCHMELMQFQPSFLHDLMLIFLLPILTLCRGLDNGVGVRMTQQQNDTVCHLGTEGHFDTVTKWHSASLYHSNKMTQCFID